MCLYWMGKQVGMGIDLRVSERYRTNLFYTGEHLCPAVCILPWPCEYIVRASVVDTINCPIMQQPPGTCR
jgi:hypothetical protein